MDTQRLGTPLLKGATKPNLVINFCKIIYTSIHYKILNGEGGSIGFLKLPVRAL